MKKLILITAFLVSFFGMNAQSDSTSIADTTNKVEEMVEEMPEYPGGDAARAKFISKKIKYPQKAWENKIEGKVIVSFIIEQDGSLSGITIVKDIGYGCGEEVMRVVKKMPKWKPGMQRGKTVRVRVSMPVVFKMPKED